MINEIKAKFTRESKKYQSFRKESVQAQINSDELDTDNRLRIEKAKTKLEKALQQEQRFTDEYAEKIFYTLSEIQPLLIRRRDRVIVTWEQAFGNDFSKISSALRGSLVALIEEDGGQYRLKDND